MSRQLSAWSPSTNPIHYLIEVHDVLHGGLDRLTALAPTIPWENESVLKVDKYQEEYQRYEALRGSVTQLFLDRKGPREEMTGIAVGAIADKLPTDGINKIRGLIYGLIQVVEGYVRSQAVTFFEIPRKKPAEQELAHRQYLTDRCKELQKLRAEGRELRAILFRVMGEARIPSDRAVAARDFRLDAAVQFRNLPPTVPEYVGSQEPMGQGPASARVPKKPAIQRDWEEFVSQLPPVKKATHKAYILWARDHKRTIPSLAKNFTGELSERDFERIGKEIERLKMNYLKQLGRHRGSPR